MPPWLAHMDFTALRISLVVAMVATVVAMAVGVPCAWLLAKRTFRGRNALEALGSLPLVLPPTVLGYYLLVTLGRQSVLGRGIEALTGHSLVFTVGGAIVASTFHAFPLFLRTARVAIESVDPSLEQAARTLGASEWRIAKTITLPLARAGIIAAATLAFARALGEFGVTLMVAGNIPGKTRTAALALYDALQSGRDADAQGLALVLTSFALFALWAVGRWSRA